MIVHKDKIVFKTEYLNSEEGRMSQTKYEIETVSDKWPDDFEKVKILNKACEKYQKVYKDGTRLAK